MSRYFGVELEFDRERISREVLETRFNTALRSVYSSVLLTHIESPRTWTIKGDPSCGHEITTPALDACPAVFDKLKRILDHFDAQRSTNERPLATYKCGLHVHISIMSMDPRQIRNLIRTFYRVENNIMSLCPPSRCGRVYLFHQDNIPLRDWIDDFNVDSADPNGYLPSGPGRSMFDRRGMHLGRLHSTGTFEVRYQGGTSKSDKAINWVKYLLYLVEISKNISGEGSVETLSFEDHLEWIREQPTLVPWMEEEKPQIINWLQRRKNHLDSVHSRQTAIRERNVRIRERQEEETRAIARERNRMRTIDDQARETASGFNWGDDADDGSIE